MSKPSLRLAMILPRIDQRNYFLGLFRMRYTVILDRRNPQLVLYDDYSWHEVPRYSHSPIYIAFTGESRPLDYSHCHLALSFDEAHPKSIYLPLWVLFIDWFNTRDPDYCKLTDIISRPVVTKIDRTLFCGFVASNSVPARNNFVNTLSKYKTVTCPGIVLNNYPKISGSMGQAKEMFLRKCKFTVAFENVSKPGYITEKLLHAFQSRTIPIYWGSPTVTRYFNPKAFINCHDYRRWDDVIAEIKRLDNSEQAWLEMINQPVFVRDSRKATSYSSQLLPAQFWPSAVLTSIEKFVNLS